MGVILMLALLGQADPGEEAIVLHEWGVVVYQAGTVTATGGCGSWIIPEEPVARAPVVYFHGAPFTGSVRVASIGTIFDTYPTPDISWGGLEMMGGLGSCIEWTHLEVFDPAAREMRRGLPDPFQTPSGDLWWAAAQWRTPDALVLERSDGFQDCFLYYEVDLTGTGMFVPVAGMAPEGTGPDELVTGEMLLFHRSPDGVLTFELLQGGDPGMAGSTAPFAYSYEESRSIIGGWASDCLTDPEIEAMWTTWQPFLKDGEWGGSSLLVFRMPSPMVERVSTIIVTSDQGLPVVQERFLLGMAPIQP